VEALMDTEPTADEVDLFEQQLDVLAGDDPEDVRFDDIVEANPADVQEQRKALPEEDDER